MTNTDTPSPAAPHTVTPDAGWHHHNQERP